MVRVAVRRGGRKRPNAKGIVYGETLSRRCSVVLVLACTKSRRRLLSRGVFATIFLRYTAIPVMGVELKGRKKLNAFLDTCYSCLLKLTAKLVRGTTTDFVD